MSTQKNLITLCFATVFALGLAACGGGGGDRAMMPTMPVVDPPDPPGPTPEEMTKAAETKAMAIGKVKPDNLLLADVGVTVTAKRTGPEIEVEGDDEFTHVMGPMYSLMHDADDDGNVVQEIVLVDHTITSPKRTSFATVYPKIAGTWVSTDTTNDGGEGTDDDTFEALTVVDANAMLVKSDDFVAGTATETTLKYDGDDTNNNNMDDAAEVAGTYDGAPGTYRCNGTADCTVVLTRGPMGKITTGVTGAWVFTPDPGAKVYVVDTEYASFGVWLKRTTDEDGVLTYNMVDTFADGTMAAANVADVDGTASYKGSALGVYVHNVLDAGGEVASATSGMFTADAALTASFGQTGDDIATDVTEMGSIVPDHTNTITGTIDNFELPGGEAQNWSVELARGVMGAINDDGTFVDGTTKGGGAEGKYSGTFYGPTMDGAPSDVSGEFTANFLNGHVAGGFGATKQDD